VIPLSFPSAKEIKKTDSSTANHKQPSSPIMSDFSIPSAFHQDVNEIHAPNLDLKQPQKQQKSFVQAVNNVCDIPTNQLPKPYLKGNKISITILEDDYEAGIDDCKHCLHGKVIWPKGTTLVSVVALRTVLASLWNSIGASQTSA
jgi:hypothetical protein